MLPLRILAAHSERVLIRSLSALATSCLTTLGCALARMHIASMCLRRLHWITPQGTGTGADTAFPGCSRGDGGGGAVLTLLLRPAMTTASGTPMTDSCCTVPCCHDEHIQANEALVVLDSPYALPVAARIRLAGALPQQ